MASVEMLCPSCMTELKPQRLNFTEVMLKCSTCFFPLDAEDVSRYIFPADDPRLAAVAPAPRKRRRETSVDGVSQFPGGAPTSARKKRRSTSTRRTSTAPVATPIASPASIRPQLQPQPALSLEHHSSSDIDSLLSGLLDFDDAAMALPSTTTFGDTTGGMLDSSSSSSSSLSVAHSSAGTLSEDALSEFLFFDIGHDDTNSAATTNGMAVVDFDNLDSLLAADELTAVYSPPGNTASCDDSHGLGGRPSDDQRGAAVERACVVASSPSTWSSARGHGEEEALLFSTTTSSSSSSVRLLEQNN